MNKLIRAMADGLSPEDVLVYKGGKGTPPPTTAVAPTPPVEEASLEIEDPDKKKKLETGKSSLKMPMAPAKDTGLKI